jgi:hypothetical protein
MPPQDPFVLGSQSWVHLLALHEWRHVQQYNFFNRGNAALFGTIFGQYGRAAANAAAIPDWYFEGDAVQNETRLSLQGRGRLPFFFNGYKSLAEANLHYNYAQLRNTSFRNFIPDHYQLGHILISYGLEKYGTDFWQPVVKEASALKKIYPFQAALKKEKNIDFNQFRQAALQWYEEKFSSELSLFSDTVSYLASTKPERNNKIVNYRFGYSIAPDSIICFKTTQQDIPFFVSLSATGEESKVAVKDISVDDYFSYNARKIIYAAWQPDVRWGNREYTYIKAVNIDTKHEEVIAKKGKFFSPDISHSGNQVVSVSMDETGKSALLFWSSLSLPPVQIAQSSNLVYSHPKFSADDQSVIVMVRTPEGYMTIQQIDLTSYTVRDLLPLVNRIIGFPVIHGDTVLYSSTYAGQDAVCALNIQNGQQWLLARAGLGLYQGVLTAGGKLISSKFTAGGYKLVQMEPLWQPFAKGSDTLSLLYASVPVQTPSQGQTADKTPLPEVYKKGQRLFNFHSLLPYFNLPEYSLTLYGENVLNTFQSQVQYVFNSNENYHQANITGIFGGSYLQPYASSSYTINRNVLLAVDTLISWNEFAAGAGLQLPLNFSKGELYQHFSFSSSVNVNQRSYDSFSKSIFDNRLVFFSSNTLQYQVFSQRALQQVLPRMGLNIVLRNRHAMNVTANNFSMFAQLFLPGALKTHSLVFNVGYQRRDTLKNFFFTNVFPFSRGYNAIDYPRMSRFGFDYQMPLFYPDWGFAELFFLNRIRLNLFAESTKARNKRTTRVLSYKTIGTEVFFDTRWFNQQPLTIGVRYSYLLNALNHNEVRNQVEFILPVSLFP